MSHHPDSGTPVNPNIVILLVDDMGYGDTSCMNPDGIWKLGTLPGVDAATLDDYS